MLFRLESVHLSFSFRFVLDIVVKEAKRQKDSETIRQCIIKVFQLHFAKFEIYSYCLLLINYEKEL